MRWKPHVRFGRRAGETRQQKRRQGAPARSHLANTKADETRRRVQNETMGHRGRKTDPLYRIRRLLTKADERLTDQGRTKLVGLLTAGDPRGEVRMAWYAKEVVRQIYTHTDPDLALSTSSVLAGISKTIPVRPRSNRWAAPSSAGKIRSLRGTRPTCRTDRPKPLTT
jgi:hypothetical protein